MNKKNSLLPIIIIAALFFVFGFVTWLNSVLIPYLQTACELSNFEAFFVTFAFYISYFVMAIPSSWVLEKTGFKNGMSLGLVVMAIGSLIFIPAAQTRMFELFLVGLFVQGTGLSILQTASNPYVTIVGPIESAAKRISIMGIANKIAGAISPLILGAVVLSDSKEINAKLQILSGEAQKILLDDMALRVITPYIIMTIVLVILAVLLKFSPLPEIDLNEEKETDENIPKRKNIFQYPYLLLGVLAIFFYVGVEVIAGDSIIRYGMSLDLPAINVSIFSYTINFADPINFTTYTLIGMLLGYIVGIITIPKIISQGNALRLFSVLGILFAIVAIFTSGFTSILFIALLGFANAIMWPAIWPLAIQNLGRFTKLGSALLIMGISGGAILPLLYGKIGDISNLQNAYWILVPCYLFILFFAVKGHKIGKYE
jgi:MFS transporter, FHS family, L-fucose permease